MTTKGVLDGLAAAALLRAAALLVPSAQRREWLAEWQAEVWYLRRSNLRAAKFCAGAVSDALWLRRNPDVVPMRLERLGSPATCLIALTALALIATAIFVQSPGARSMGPFAPGPAVDLVKISARGQSRSQFPSVTLAQYRAVAADNHLQFTHVGFYRPQQTLVSWVDGSARVLSLAVGNDSLRNLLELPSATNAHEATLVLSDAARRRLFGPNKRVQGAVVNAGGIQARVTTVLPPYSWKLLGWSDGWLITGDEALSARAPETKGFVLAGRDRDAGPSRWRLTLNEGEAGTAYFDCIRLDGWERTKGHLVALVLALVILPATTSLCLGARVKSAFWLPLWFLGLKTALLVVIVCLGVLDLAELTATPIQIHGLVVGYVLAFRWALIDQRSRCPVCLTRLGHPTRIGQSSQTFLEWYGTELVCSQGHGLMHVTEISSSCYSDHRWLRLDPSWASLFLPRKAPAVE